MFLKITEKIIWENDFEQKKKKPELNLTLGYALIGLRTTGPRAQLFKRTISANPGLDCNPGVFFFCSTEFCRIIFLFFLEHSIIWL